MPVITVLIMGAAGRDFHNFNVVFRDRPEYRVVAFTAAQIPNIAGRRYPPALAGSLYPEGIPIHPEEELESLIAAYRVDQVIFAYSDVSHEAVMHQASRVLSAGADFSLLGGRRTMVAAKKPVVSVCAVRTGAGKSPATRKIASLLCEEGLRVAVIRHPMPYGDLAKQAVQRFACLEDLRAADCTIEEMEEYEPHIRDGHVVFAGVDYERILREAEREADVLVWDGGNNDVPFFLSDLEIVLVDPHRAGHERTYFPGEVNLLRADVLVLTKMDTASPEQVREVRANIRQFNPAATVLETAMPVTVDYPHLIKGKRVLVVEDGPTLTHGGMSFGAGVLAAKQQGASELVDPRPYAVGTIQQTFTQYPHIGNLVPAMGYGATQVRELEDTINRVPCDVVLIATPVDLRRIISIKQPTCRVTYRFEELGAPGFRDLLAGVIGQARKG
ncbi:MAG: cyclic 2,3-diphosphoglycerate synthase [Nitrospirota bacterium]|nr:cyclic 2,3-diphosphoglycerate synthase [Nitrospirota bacterium]